MAVEWTEALDRRLLAGRAAGSSFAEVAERIGVSRSAAIGRHHRLMGTSFPSQSLRGRAEHDSGKAMRIWKEQKAIEGLDLAIACGEDRNSAMIAAYRAGCRAVTIAEKFEITLGRVYQLVGKTRL